MCFGNMQKMLVQSDSNDNCVLILTREGVTTTMDVDGTVRVNADVARHAAANNFFWQAKP